MVRHHLGLKQPQEGRQRVYSAFSESRVSPKVCGVLKTPLRAFPGLFRILRMCAPRRAAAVVRPRGREKSADRRRRILISRLLIIRASVPRRKSPFPAYFKGFPAVSPLIPPYPTFLKYPVSPQRPKAQKSRLPAGGRRQRSGKIRPQSRGRPSAHGCWS